MGAIFIRFCTLATATARLVLVLWKLYEAVTCAMTAAIVQKAEDSFPPLLSCYLSDVHQMTPDDPSEARGSKVS